MRHLENQHGHRLHGLRRKVNRALGPGPSTDQRVVSENEFEIGTCGRSCNLLFGTIRDTDSKVLQRGRERIIEQEMEKIDLMSMPTNLICPILFYHSHSSALKDSNNSDYNTLTEQLGKVRQCSAQTECTQNTICEAK